MTFFNASIIKKYDIRGVFPEEINAHTANYLAQAFTHSIGAHPLIVVGADGRLSSPPLLESVINGCLAQGATVYCIGTVPSPVVYYASKMLDAQAAIMITASHSPAHYNGFKYLHHQRPFYGDSLQQLKTLHVPTLHLSGVLKTLDIREQYIRTLVKDLPLKFNKRLKIVWDPGHGTVATILPKLLHHLDADHIIINNTVDGHFPSHHPDPMVPNNMQQLRQMVCQQKADIGFGFDGDGDRLGMIDSTGRQWNNDSLLAFFAKHILKKNPGGTVLMDIKSSQSVFDAIRRWGGNAHFIPTGYAVLREKMVEYNALLGGEFSGHFVFSDCYFGYDDALYAALRVISILLENTENPAVVLNEFRTSLPQMVSTPAVRFPCSQIQGQEIIQAIQQHLLRKNRQFVTIDGVRVQTPRGWWLVRQSQTEDGLVVRCEAFDDSGLAHLKEEIKAYFKAHGFDQNF